MLSQQSTENAALVRQPLWRFVRHEEKATVSSPPEAYLVMCLRVICFTLLPSGCPWRVALAFFILLTLLRAPGRDEYRNIQVAAHEAVLETGCLLWPKTRTTAAFSPSARCHQCCHNNMLLFYLRSMLTLKQGDSTSRNADAGDQQLGIKKTGTALFCDACSTVGGVAPSSPL